MKWLVAALLLLAATPVMAQPQVSVEPGTEAMVDGTWARVKGAAEEVAARGLPYVLSLHLVLVLLDLCLFVYRHQFAEDWLGGFFWRVIAHLIVRTFIAWSVVPNPLTGGEGWGYAMITWSHDVGANLTSGGLPGSGLSVAGLLATLGQFVTVMILKLWQALAGSVILYGFLGPLAYMSFWLTIAALAATVGWIGYVTIDAVLTASLGFFALAFYGSEYTAGLGNRYLVALVQRALKLLTAYFMVSLGLVLIDQVWTPWMADMNPLNPLSWLALMLMVVLYAWFAVWRLPRTIAGAFGEGDAIRLDTLLHAGRG